MLYHGKILYQKQEHSRCWTLQVGKGKEQNSVGLLQFGVQYMKNIRGTEAVAASELCNPICHSLHIMDRNPRHWISVPPGTLAVVFLRSYYWQLWTAAYNYPFLNITKSTVTTKIEYREVSIFFAQVKSLSWSKKSNYYFLFIAFEVLLFFPKLLEELVTTTLLNCVSASLMPEMDFSPYLFLF